ncbi:hypothetical protein EKPJFOCH_2052 [Methylobacterium thuringiense]|uniref:Glycosyltransferase 61 catalytic domain-containing protein n=2 Tax=Methylobacterium thuringiense TaxID=1003091 RepID=A0ABQ4TJV1_9HYPH|nr:hypothetical protein EKPJFOCH_2052 [Methylobacterium thuringiense]
MGPVLVIALALSSEESALLNQEILSDPILNGMTFLGDVARDDFSPSVFARSWLVWRGNLPTGLAEKILRAFREAIGLPNKFAVETLEPLMAQRVEVVSLRTAAAATGGEFGRHQEADTIFDMHARTYNPLARPLEFAALSHAIVLPSASWKVLTADRLYIEEVGYVERERPHLVECWPEFGASWTIRAAGPVFNIPSAGHFTFLLGGDAAHYHLLLNWLPRLKMLDDPRVAMLVGEYPRIAISNRFTHKETSLIERLLGREIDFVRVPEVGAYRFSNLIIPSFFSHHELTPAVADWYRAKLLIGPPTRERRIYISRADARAASTPRRKVINEAEVIAYLSIHGFEAVELGGMSMDEQIALFREVTFVVAPHGAGLANMVFAPPNANAVVLENSWAHQFIADMLKISGHCASILVCEDSYSEVYESELRQLGYPDTEIQRSRDMIVDCVELQRVIEKHF